MRQQGKRVIGKVEILARNDDGAAKVAAFRLRRIGSVPRNRL